MGLADYFDPDNIKLVDKFCVGCKHRTKLSGLDYNKFPGDTGYSCCYATDTGHSRPCPAGKGCTEKVTSKRKKEGVVILHTGS